VALAARVRLLPGAGERVFIDIDSLLRPVYGYQKQGASFGHAKTASRALLRLGLSPQITTISTAQAPRVIAEARLRSVRAASGRATASQIKGDISTARACRRTGTILVRGDSAFGTKKVITTSSWAIASRCSPSLAAPAAVGEVTPHGYPTTRRVRRKRRR
jgi:hypothetical protein